MLLTIVIAVYNIENYIEKCLSSVTNLMTKDIEIILVIGDSVDNSNNICKKYEEQYENIVIVRQNGKGLSNARNCAFSVANGKYIMFIDGDDCIISESLDDILDKIRLLNREIDVLITDFVTINNSGKTIATSTQIKSDINFIDDYNYLKKFMEQRGAFWNVWRYIYRRDFLLENNITFKENVMAEDLDYVTQIFTSTKNIFFYHTPYYCYRRNRPNSLMNSNHIIRVKDVIANIQCSVKTLEKNTLFEYKDLMRNKFLFEYILNMVNIAEVSKEDRAEIKKSFASTLYLINLQSYPFGKIIYNLIKNYGFEFIAYLLFILKKIKDIKRYRL